MYQHINSIMIFQSIVILIGYAFITNFVRTHRIHTELCSQNIGFIPDFAIEKVIRDQPSHFSNRTLKKRSILHPHYFFQIFRPKNSAPAKSGFIDVSFIGIK